MTGPAQLLIELGSRMIEAEARGYVPHDRVLRIVLYAIRAVGREITLAEIAAAKKVSS